MTKDSGSKVHFNKVIGENCQRARDYAGMSRKTAMQRIFKYKDENQLNRITELEHGAKSLTVPVLYELCITYGCSADFILGISNEIERNYAATHNGLIVETLRSTALEMADTISSSMSELLKHMPKFEGELLLTASKNMLSEIDQNAHDLAFRGTYPGLIDASNELRAKIRLFEVVIAKMARAAELNMIQHLENYERPNLNLTRDFNDKPEPLNPEIG